MTIGTHELNVLPCMRDYAGRVAAELSVETARLAKLNMPVWIECIDCGGDGVEKIPIGAGRERCEFCGGSGELEVSVEKFAELKLKWPRSRKLRKTIPLTVTKKQRKISP